MSLQNELVEVCRKVYAKGFVSAYDGNISARLPGNNFLITRSGQNKGEITESDFVEIDSNGKVLKGEGKVSSEFRIHLYIYRMKPDINAVVHCHPVYATAFASSGQSFPDNIFPEVILTLGQVPLCKYATPSTDQLPESMAPYVKSCSAFLLQNHGAVTAGKSIKEAYYKMEKLEHTANILFAARALGGEQKIPEEKVKELKEIFGI